MTRARARSSSRGGAEQQVEEGGRRPRRGLAIANFSCAPATSIWYYRVDVSVYQQATSSVVDDVNDDDSSSDDDNSSDDGTDEAAGVEHYSILRRYNEFLQLYEAVRHIVVVTEGSAICMPPFPGKEYFSVGLLWRMSSSRAVLEDRRVKFEALLRWIEHHPVARSSPAFVKFLGKAPQSQDGYVSLKEYTSPDWLSSLQQVTDTVEGRKRRYSAGSCAISSLLERSYSVDPSGVTGSRLRRLDSVKEIHVTRVLGKRRNRPVCRHRHVGKKLARLEDGAAQKLPNTDQVPQSPLSCGKRKTVVPVEGNNPRKKLCSTA